MKETTYKITYCLIKNVPTYFNSIEMVYLAISFHGMQERILQPIIRKLARFTIHNNPEINYFRISLAAKL
jgi:hypothetical protein